MKPKYFVHKKCNFCGSPVSHVIYKFDSQKLVKCSQCGLVYFDKQRNDLENIYDQDYFYQSESNDENYFDYSSRDQKELMEGNFGFAFNYIKKNTSTNKRYDLLDVGAGFGYFIKYLPQNINSYAVEVSKIACDNLRKRKIRVYEGDFLAVAINKKFDFICALDVIEHQIDLSAFFKNVNHLLKKGGIFIFTTPNYGSFLNKIFGRKAPAIQPLYHNYYFDCGWLAKNLTAFGFSPISLKTVYFTKMTFSHLLLMSSFAAPWIRKLKLMDFITKLKLDPVLIDFFRFGGINGIVKKVK